MIYIKCTEGYMRQVFDTATGKFISQEFVVGEDSQWEDEQGERLADTFWDEKQFGPYGPYLPYLDEDLNVGKPSVEQQMPPDALREEKVEALVANDIRSLTRDLAEGDSSYLTDILTGEGWTQYSKMTDEQINEEYENLQNNKWLTE